MRSGTGGLSLTTPKSLECRFLSVAGLAALPVVGPDVVPDPVVVVEQSRQHMSHRPSREAVWPQPLTVMVTRTLPISQVQLVPSFSRYSAIGLRRDCTEQLANEYLKIKT